MVTIVRELSLPQDEHNLHEAQLRWAREVIIRPLDLNRVRTIAAADVAYESEAGGDRAYAAVVVTDASGSQILDQAIWTGVSDSPYAPGRFALREAACLLEAFRLLKTVPDVVLIEGHGRAHPRQFGLACVIGLSLDLPTIGCAKTPLYGVIGPLGDRRGDQSEIRDPSGEVLGCALRTQDGVKPVYVSPGYGVDVPSAAAVVLGSCSRYRIPDPQRWAHQYSVGARQKGR